MKEGPKIQNLEDTPKREEKKEQDESEEEDDEEEKEFDWMEGFFFFSWSWGF